MSELKKNEPTSLTDEQLDAIAGGLIIDEGPSANPATRYAVVDDKTGQAICFTNELQEALITCNGGRSGQEERYEPTIITPQQYEERFGIAW